MTERATIAQVVQLGVETVPGTQVPANKKLQALGFSLTPNIDTKLVRPIGSKYPTISVPGKDWTALSLAGEASYEDLCYAFASILKSPVITGAGPYIYTYTPSITTADTVKTFTVEKGEEGAEAESVAGVQVNELKLAFNRDGIEVSGAAFGRAIAFNADMTNTPTSVPLTPIQPADVCVYWDTTSAGLGTTKLTRVLSASWMIGGRFNPLWVLDCAEPSYVASVEGVPTITVELMLEANDQANAFVDTYLRTGTKGWNRIQATGDSNHDMKLDTAMVVTGVGELSDQDGVYAFNVTLAGVADATWAKATEVVMKNQMVTL